MVSFVAEIHTKKWFSQRNNGYIPSSNKKALLATHNVPPMSWPAKSLHLNPKKQSIGSFSRQRFAEGRQFESSTAFKRKVETKWGKVGDQLRLNFVARNPKRPTAVLEAASRSTK